MVSFKIYVTDFQEYKKNLTASTFITLWYSNTSLFLFQGYMLKSNMPTQAY